MIFLVCTSSLYKIMHNMILSCSGNYLYKTCITWFFSCHKNHVRWGIASMLFTYFARVKCLGKADVDIVFKKVWITLNTLWQGWGTGVGCCIIKQSIKMYVVHTLEKYKTYKVLRYTGHFNKEVILVTGILKSEALRFMFLMK